MVVIRSPNAGNGNNVWNVNTTGQLSNNNATNAYGVAADCTKEIVQGTVIPSLFVGEIKIADGIVFFKDSIPIPAIFLKE